MKISKALIDNTAQMQIVKNPVEENVLSGANPETDQSDNSFLKKHKATIIYSLSMAMLLFLLKWLELRFIIFNNSYEIYIGFIAVIFTSLGIWLALKLSKPKVETVIVEKEVYVDKPAEFIFNRSLAKELELSKKELDVLRLIASGYSNREIAAQLFISLSTVKAHNQNLFFKLDVKRRTQAIEKAKRLNIIP